ncbi:hypothetical protein PVAP13_2KG198374 [Panicum virgatum]|uniref:Uncharacterized protein n=1 Tax=Panicum virgatum TaxID=38727 RepID=A0A8T0WC59_PANVG|nr:hypothetical protein PVAP13_2KG198374 [Panicum virgatum]
MFLPIRSVFSHRRASLPAREHPRLSLSQISQKSRCRLDAFLPSIHPVPPPWAIASASPATPRHRVALFFLLLLPVHLALATAQAAGVTRLLLPPQLRRCATTLDSSPARSPSLLSRFSLPLPSKSGGRRGESAAFACQSWRPAAGSVARM